MKVIIPVLVLIATLTAAQACRWGETCMTNAAGITYCSCNSGPG